MNSKSLFSHLRSFIAKSPITLICQVSTTSLGAFFVLALAILVAGTSTPTASAQTVTYTGAGAVNFGSANVCLAGKTTPAPCSKTLTLTYNVTESGTLGTPQALTTGQPNLDFKLAGGSTCTGNVTKGNTCTVNATFAPIAPGARNGAVEILDTHNQVLATTYIYGNALGSYPAQPDALKRFIGPTTVDIPWGVAVDAGGNGFVSYPAGGIRELLAVDGVLPANPVVKTIGTGEYTPGTLAIDGAGNLFSAISDFEPYVFEIIAAGGYSIIKPIDSGFTYPSSIAVDGSGNLFICSSGGGSSLKEFFAADGYTTGKALGNGFNFGELRGVVVDGSGNVFVISVDMVEEVPATGDYTTVRVINLPTGEFNSLYSIAVDPAGNLLLESDSLLEALAVDGVVPLQPTVVALPPFFGGYSQIALEGNGNILTSEEVSISNSPNDNPQGGQVVEWQLGRQSPLVPEITGLSSAYGAPYSVVILNGTNFGATQGSSTVTFNGIDTPHYYWADTKIYVTVPPNATSGNVVVTVNGNASNPFGFTVLPQPAISGISPTSGPAGTVVTINGANLLDHGNRGTVTLNGKQLAILSQFSTALKVAVPSGAVTGVFHVLVNDTGMNSPTFTVTK